MTEQPTILVTGGTGFIGSYLLRYLVSKGYRSVRALRRADSSLALVAEAAEAVEWVEGDVLDLFSLEAAMEGVDTVIHCAAMVSFAAKDRKTLRQVNVQGTTEVVNAALSTGVRRLLHVSSVAALDRPSDGPFITENSKWQQRPGVSDYALSKAMAEREVWRGQAEGLRVAVAYPSIVLGSGDWSRGTPRLFHFADQRQPFYPVGGAGVVDVRDVACSLLALLERDTDGDRVILNAENLSYQTLLGMMAEALDRPPPRLAVGRWATPLLRPLLAIWAYLSGGTYTLTPQTLTTAQQWLRYDNTHSRQLLNLTYTPIHQTIAETAADYRLAKAAGDWPVRVLPIPT